jgi:hypothetical protein
MGAKRNAYKISVGKPAGKRPLGRPRRSRVNNIEMDLREIRWGGMDWIDLAQDRDQWRALMDTLINFRFDKSGKFLSGCTTSGFSSRTQLNAVSYLENCLTIYGRDT